MNDIELSGYDLHRRFTDLDYQSDWTKIAIFVNNLNYQSYQYILNWLDENINHEWSYDGYHFR
jgi:hypothetical protein